MDGDHDGLLNFKEFVTTVDLLCKGDHANKLKLLYCLHLPGIVLPGELLTPVSEVDGAEVALDATDFFKNEEGSNEEPPDRDDHKKKERNLTPEGLGSYDHRNKKKPSNLISIPSILQRTMTR